MFSAVVLRVHERFFTTANGWKSAYLREPCWGNRRP